MEWIVKRFFLKPAYSESGKLVPDELVDEMVKHQLGGGGYEQGYILDGYPRTEAQAEVLSSYQDIHLVVNIILPTEVLLTKLLGRRVCSQCGRGYNVADIQDGDLDMPPLLPQPDDCDTCHGEPDLITRDDDVESVVRDRLAIYERQTEPVLHYFREHSKVLDFDVKKGIEDTPRLLTEMGYPDLA